MNMFVNNYFYFNIMILSSSIYSGFFVIIIKIILDVYSNFVFDDFVNEILNR